MLKAPCFNLLKVSCYQSVAFNTVSTANLHLYIVVGETGSGKSTQLVQYAASPELGDKKVLCSEPRKVAAATLSTHVSHQWHSSSSGGPGGVGYTLTPW